MIELTDNNIRIILLPKRMKTAICFSINKLKHPMPFAPKRHNMKEASPMQ